MNCVLANDAASRDRASTLTPRLACEEQAALARQCGAIRLDERSAARAPLRTDLIMELLRLPKRNLGAAFIGEQTIRRLGLEKTL